jgi:hypothetical protein
MPSKPKKGPPKRELKRQKAKRNLFSDDNGDEHKKYVSVSSIASRITRFYKVFPVPDS